MFVPKKLKLNRFKVVNLPSNKDYFARFGNRTLPEQMFTGDEFAPSASRKIDQIVDYEAYDRMMQERELSQSNGDQENS